MPGLSETVQFNVTKQEKESASTIDTGAGIVRFPGQGRCQLPDPYHRGSVAQDGPGLFVDEVG